MCNAGPRGKYVVQTGPATKLGLPVTRVIVWNAETPARLVARTTLVTWTHWPAPRVFAWYVENRDMPVAVIIPVILDVVIWEPAVV